MWVIKATPEPIWKPNEEAPCPSRRQPLITPRPVRCSLPTSVGLPKQITVKIRNHEFITHSLVVIHHTVAGRVTGPDISTSLQHKFTLATLLCWWLTSIIFGVRASQYVPTAKETTEHQILQCPTGRHMTRFSRRCALTSKYHPIQDAYGANWSGSG